MNPDLNELLTKPVKIHISATGSGAGIQNALWQIPGCSSFFAGAQFPYEHTEQEEFIGFKPGRVCIETAMDMAMRSYMRACVCAGDRMPIGLGITTSVASLEVHRGDHRIHAALVSDGQIRMVTKTLNKAAGVAARYTDGLLTDALGLQMILDASGIPRDVSASDGTELALSRLFEHPLFMVDGTRQKVPSGSITLYPGAFNPPHAGHFAAADRDTIFHITADHPHKLALTVPQMLRRAVMFKGHHHVLFSKGDPLYLDKARRFLGSTIILGTDALVRMLDPKWGHEVEPLLTEFAALGTTFKVALRGSDNLSDVPIPDRFQHLFTALPRNAYANLSSTQIREARVQ